MPKAKTIEKIDLSIKKKLKLSQDIEEELTVEEVIERYEPYLCNKSIQYAKHASAKYFKHTFYFDYDVI
jgi:hypothetical protein